MEADGVTVNDPEVVCNGHSDNGNSEELKAIERRQRAA